MKLTTRQKQKITEAWIKGTASDSKKQGVFVALRDNIVAQFFTIDELHNTIEIQIQKVSVKRGFESIVKRLFAQSPESAVKQIGAL